MLRVIGVHPLDGEESVYLIEVQIAGKFDDVDWSSITQPAIGVECSNWQVAYDEREIGNTPDGEVSAAFFFHYLDTTRPLQSAYGFHPLPAPSPIPHHLEQITYEAP